MASVSIPVWYTLIPGEDFLFFIEILSEEHLNDGTGEEAKDKCLPQALQGDSQERALPSVPVALSLVQIKYRTENRNWSTFQWRE